jgi:hypothetical protein
MLHAAVTAAFEVDESFGNLEFAREKIDKFLVGSALDCGSMERDHNRKIVEFIDDLSFPGIRFDVDDDDHS